MLLLTATLDIHWFQDWVRRALNVARATQEGPEKRLVFLPSPREHLAHQIDEIWIEQRGSRTNEMLHSTQLGGPGSGKSCRSRG